jgi:GMP synthase-like glutamine amidotransferase
MRAHYLQHVPFEGLGSISRWLGQRVATVSGTKLFKGEALPPLDGIDLLIALGGPMSVNDEKNNLWLADEKAFIREAIEEGIAVVGICLGAQLIAAAMGARVYPNPEKEIGWFPLHSVRTVDRSVFRFPPSFTAFHWHGETFDLPDGATLLARSAGCENQAFQLGELTIGLQFHLETTPGAARDLIAHCGAELAPSRYVQSADEILSVPEATFEALHALMDDVLEYVSRD